MSTAIKQRQRRYLRHGTIVLLVALLLPGVVLAVAGPFARDSAAVRVTKQVALLVEPGQLLASNVRLGRIDPLELEPGEQLVAQVEASASLAVATDRRVLAYGPVIGWRTLALFEAEQVESLQAEDYAVFIVTNQRYLNFNADSGIWGEQPRLAP